MLRSRRAVVALVKNAPRRDEVVTSRVDGRLYAVVNVNTFDGVDPALLRPASANLDGESETDRLARRARNWIADVAFEASR